MKTVNIYKAQAIGDQRIESVTITIDATLPQSDDRYRDWLKVATRLFDEEAAKIVDALHSLPGGTLDRVLVKLLTEKVSQHIVPWEKHG